MLQHNVSSREKKNPEDALKSSGFSLWKHRPTAFIQRICLYGFFYIPAASYCKKSGRYFSTYFPSSPHGNFPKISLILLNWGIFMPAMTKSGTGSLILSNHFYQLLSFIFTVSFPPKEYLHIFYIRIVYIFFYPQPVLIFPYPLNSLKAYLQ